MYWWNSEKGTGYSIPYDRMIIHAVSRDTQRFSQPCIYMQLESLEDPEDIIDGDEQSENSPTTEVRVVIPEEELCTFSLLPDGKFI